MTEIQAFPLCWPVGYKRSMTRYRSKFKQTPEKVQKFLHSEINKLGGINLVVSTNIPIRKDGGFYSEYAGRSIDDPGVAIYFNYKGKNISMCCDQYLSVHENICALGKGIEALRGMNRWGVSDFIERAFTGFAALPESRQTVKKEWWDILGTRHDAREDEIKTAYRVLAKKYHPDVNKENPEYFDIVKRAYEEGMKI